MTKGTYRLIAIIILIMTIGFVAASANDFLTIIFSNLVLIVGSLIAIVVFLIGNIRHMDEEGTAFSVIIFVILQAIIFLMFLFKNFELSNSIDKIAHNAFEFFKALE